jgi:hypothetical protein
MIQIAQSLPIGNAVSIHLTADSEWRLVRSLSLAPGAAFQVIDAGEAGVSVVIDSDNLLNGQSYCYTLLVSSGGEWVADGEGICVSPSVTVDSVAVDPLSIVRERIAAAITADISSGRLHHKDGRVRVLNAPPQFENVNFPVIVCQLVADEPDLRGLGDMFPDLIGSDGVFEEFSGWLSRVTINIGGWSLNPDQRIALRHAIKRAIIGNLPVFHAAGLNEVAVSFSDSDDFNSFDAPVYTTMARFTCLAPSVNKARITPLTDVQITLEDITP